MAARGVVEPSDRIRIHVPRFQRGLVWAPEKKEALIDSIYQGFPIGALLLSDAGKDGDVQVYSLIDGLQRTNAITEHLEQPLAAAPRAVVPDKEVELLRQALSAVLDTEIDREVLVEILLSWLHETRVLSGEAGFEWSALLEFIVDRASLPKPDLDQINSLKPQLNPIVDRIRDLIDIGNVQVPVLIYSGEQDQLPDIFERLNRSGTTLSKYQIFAASWIRDATRVTSAEIRGYIAEKYKELEDQGFVLEKDDSDDETYSLFEYLFGLSRLLETKYPRLFRQAQSSADTSSIAFSLATLARGKPLDQMAKLPDFIGPRDGNDRLELGLMEKAILEAAKTVDEALAPFLGLRLTLEASGLAHGELQMVSLLASVLAHRYESDGSWNERPGWPVTRERFRTSIPQHYLLDVVRRTWRGPLYSLAYQRVWINDGVPNDFYLQPPARDVWDNSLNVWFAEQLDKQNDRRPNVSALDKAVLKFIYGSLVTVAEQNTYEFDVEHLFPVQRLLDLWGKEGDAWPIGCIANLALLDDKTNRRKRSETIAEYFDRPADMGGPTANERESIEKFLLCDVEDLRIPQTAEGDSLTKDEYLKFLEKRWARMVALLNRALRIEEGAATE